MSKLKELLQEILDAGENPLMPLDMALWVCGTSCCLCGDVALARNGLTGPEELAEMAEGGGSIDRGLIGGAATRFARELEAASEQELGKMNVAGLVYNKRAETRRNNARYTEFFTNEELDHPHLTTDHQDRAIAHDFIRLVIAKLDERKAQE